jgi:Na+/H+-dicarboxylate symporter
MDDAFGHDHHELSDEEQPKMCRSAFCKHYTSHQLGYVILGAVIGIGAGIGLAYWTPEDPQAKETALLWIGLLGELFLRALKCVILPLIFSSITISIMDMLALGKAGKVVGHTIGLYILTTLCAAIIGVLTSLAFSGKYTELDGEGEPVVSEVRLACSVDDAMNPTSFLTEMNDGSVMCAAGDPTNQSIFMMQDVNGYYATSAEATGVTEMTLSESLYQGLFMNLIGPNMVGLFVDDNFLGVIVLAAAFGVALSRLAANPPKGVKWTQVLIVQVLEELMSICMMFVHWIIWCAPPCILSLVAVAIGGQSELGTVLETIGWLFVSFMIGILCQFFIVYCGLYYLFRRSNPFDYFKHIIEAMTLAFACASSAATLPVTLECVHHTGKVPPGVANFVLPLGATINMDGSAIWTINACIALAYLNGITPSAADYIVLAIISTLGTIGAAPVPSAGIVLILTCYETTFGSTSGSDVPYGFGFIIAIDWLTDRFITMFNVMGDTVVAALVAHDIEDDIEFAGDGKAGDLVKPAPEEPVVGMEKTERATNTYKIEDHDEGAEDVKKSTLSA